MGEVSDICFSIIVIADDAAKRKEEKGNCHKYTSYASYFVVQCMLSELYSIGRTIERSTTEKNDECCA